jgi:hypothetical protein
MLVVSASNGINGHFNAVVSSSLSTKEIRAVREIMPPITHCDGLVVILLQIGYLSRIRPIDSEQSPTQEDAERRTGNLKPPRDVIAGLGAYASRGRRLAREQQRTCTGGTKDFVAKMLISN